MKQLLFLSLCSILNASLFVEAVIAQNIGIGNTAPDYKLDISGRMRLRGGNSIDKTSGIWLSGNNADSAINKAFVGMANDSTVGFYGENGIGWALTTNTKNGRVGIGTLTPAAPLSFSSLSGNKISLFTDGNGNSYGLGIGNAVMQMITPHNNSDIVFGYGNSNSFTENMRVGGNGNVGIGTNGIGLAGLTVNKKMGSVNALFGSNTTGVAIESEFPGIGFNSYFNVGRRTIATGYSGYIGVNPESGGLQFLVSGSSNNTGNVTALKLGAFIAPDGKVGLGVSDPTYALDVASRMRIRSTPGFTAGLWLNNEANTAIPAFIGMQADNQVGFFGSGTGWSFLMNTQNGAVSFGGNAGVAGQVLTSNGNGSAPSWQGGLGSGKPFVAKPTSNSSDLGTSGRVDIPNMAANFTLAVPSQVVFNFKISIANRSCFGCGDRRTFIILVQNIVGGTTDIATTTVYTPNGEIADGVSGPIVLDLPAGTYSYKLSIAASIYGAATVYARQQEGIMTWQIFPN